MLTGKRLVVGDSGYIGEPNKISTTLSGHSPETKNYLLVSSQGKRLYFVGIKLWVSWVVDPFV
jgi:hypothetical protein